MTAAPKLFSAATFDGRPMEARPWHVRDLIPGAQVSTLDGDGGVGKSTLALQLAVATVTGREWLGFEVARGPAIYLASEDDAEELHRRLDALAVHYDLSWAALADLHLWPLAACDPALARATGDGLEATERWAELNAQIRQLRAALLVLDSRADVFAGNEIDRTQARAFVGMLRKLATEHRTAIVMLAHPSVAGMASGNGSSGSTHWRNAVRAGLYLTSPFSEDNPDRDARQLEVRKSNYGPARAKMDLRWSMGAFVAAGEAQSPIGHPIEAAAADARVEVLFLKLLLDMTAAGRTLGDVPGPNYAPTLMARDPAAKGVKSAGLARAMARLFAAGKIRVEPYGPPSKVRKRIVAVERED